MDRGFARRLGASVVVTVLSVGLLASPAPAQTVTRIELTEVMDFGRVRVGRTGVPGRTATLTNTGDMSVSVGTPTISGPDGSDFSIVATTCGGPLAPGESCTVDMTFKPSARAPREATLRIPHDAPDYRDTVRLIGRGVLPIVALSPDPLDFGRQRVGTTSRERAVTLTNVGDGDLEISGVSLEGPNAADFSRVTDTCRGRIEPGDGCAVTLTFRPSARGARQAQLVFDDDADDTPQIVQVLGLGVLGELTVSPTTVDFGSHRVGATSGTQTVTVSNTGTDDITVAGASLAGDGDFSRAADSCTGVALAPAESCGFAFTFTPQEAGARSAELTVSSDAPNGPQESRLLGTGESASYPSHPGPQPAPSPDPSPQPTPSPSASSPAARVSRINFTSNSARVGEYSDRVVLAARLIDETDAPLAGRVVIFELSGPERTRTFASETDADGVATAVPRLTEAPGSMTITAHFEGDDGLEGSTDTTSLLVEKEDTGLTLSSRWRVVRARLFDADHPSSGVAGRRVRFFVNGEFVGGATTDLEGRASEMVARGLWRHRRSIVAVFRGDSWYLPSRVKAAA
ncbi:MAG TPA: choice-of-anchor D domain-containing protein [Actinomycetota bacterium]|nr:choice-of-anchor D domain-containing protein [Actinomycetota bacterium]